MEYFIYMMDLEMMETIKNMKKNDEDVEEILYEIKANGQYLATYDERKFCELVANLGEKNALIVNKEFIDLIELKEMYETIKADFDKDIIRDFKIMIYNAISNCNGIVILKMKTKEDEKLKIEKKWYEIWKK